MARTIRDDWAIWRESERRHKEAIARKHARIGMYEALVGMWEKQETRDEDYLRDLRRRLRSEITQLKAMNP